MKKKNIILIIIGVLIVIAVAILLFALNKETYYTVTFDTDGGTKLESVKVKENTILKLRTDITKTGYVFNGWLDGEEIVSNEYKVIKDVTLKVKWKLENAQKLTISFNTGAGSDIDNVILDEGDKLILPNDPKKEGYIFAGWKDQKGNPIYDEMIITEPLTIIAIWEKEENIKEEDNNNKEDDTGKEETDEKDDESIGGGFVGITYYCDEGYILSGNRCSKSETIDFSISQSYECPVGTTKSSTNEKICILEVQTNVASLCDTGAVYTYLKNNQRYCVYKELHIKVKNSKNEEIPTNLREDICKKELGDEAVLRGLDLKKEHFICEVSDTKTAKKPAEVCGKNSKYRLLADGLSFSCYNETNVDAKPTTLYCPSGYVKNSCSSTSCSCTRTVTVVAKDK